MTESRDSALASVADAAESLLIPAKEAARLLSISESHFYELKATGKLGPHPVRLGKSVRWNRIEFQEWVAAGCPPKHKWDLQRKPSTC